MNASADMSILSLLTHASVVVQAVLAILIILSLISWTRIFQKFFQLRQAKQLSEDFESRFWSGAELNKLYEHAQNHREHSGTQERIFASGMTEFLKLSTRGSAEALDGVRRAMRATYQREMDNLESGLPTLASIGSVSPYIGLFGLQLQLVFLPLFPLLQLITVSPMTWNVYPIATKVSLKNSKTFFNVKEADYGRSAFLSTFFSSTNG